jgi:hypothetical protein
LPVAKARDGAWIETDTTPRFDLAQRSDSHAIYTSRPEAVASIINNAAFA